MTVQPFESVPARAPSPSHVVPSSSSCYELVGMLSQTARVRDVARVFSGRVRELFGAEAALFSAADPHTGALTAVEAEGFEPAVASALLAGPIAEISRGRDACWLWGDDAFDRAAFPDELRSLESVWFLAPMWGAGRRLGALALRFEGTRWFSLDQRRTLEAIVELLAQALCRVRLSEGLHLAEERLAELEEGGLQQFQKQLLAVVGHDLRGPVQAVLVNAHVIERNAAELPGGVRAAAWRISQTAHRMGELLHALFDFAGLELGGGLQLEPRQVDLGELTQAVVDELQVTTRQPIALSISGDCLGVWDGARLTQAVSNLIGNALKHGDPERPVKVSIEATAERVVLAVQNEGAQIPSEQRKNLFLPFHRGTHRGEGLGLGLYIARQVVQAHRGELAVESTAEGRTTFTISLPR